MSSCFTLLIPPGTNRPLIMTQAEFARFFDNRNPQGWPKPVTLFTADRPDPLSAEVQAMLNHPIRICSAQATD